MEVRLTLVMTAMSSVLGSSNRLQACRSRNRVRMMLIQSHEPSEQTEDEKLVEMLTTSKRMRMEETWGDLTRMVRHLMVKHQMV